MSMRKVFSATVFVFFFLFSNAQPSNEILRFFDGQDIELGSTNDMYFLCRTSVSQEFPEDEFIQSEFVDAQFVDASKKLFQSKARYNIKRNEMQILFNDKIYILYPHLIQLIQIGESFFSPLLIQTGETENYVYLQAVAMGKASLYYKINEKEKISKSLAYIKNDKGSISGIKIKKKTVLSALADRKDKVEQFATEKNLNYCNKEDLRRIFTYYNSL